MRIRATLTRGVDTLLDAVVASFASWTLVFHAAVLLDWRRDVAVAVWLASLGVLLGAAAMWRTRTLDVAPERDVRLWRPGRTAIAIGGLLTATAGGVWVLHPPGWWAFWGAVLVVSAGSVALVVRGSPLPAVTPTPSVRLGGAVAVLLLAATFAVLSAVTQRPDADDTYVVNRAVYVENHSGPFPTRDTIFADEVFRDLRPRAPESAIEPFVGAVARFLPVTAPTVAYLLLAPAVSALGILALWRLLRTARVANAVLATGAAAVFLLLDGQEHASFGNFTFARAWQGKTILVFVLVPLLWHYALTWARHGDRKALALLAAANVAALGLSSSAAFVAPLVTVLGSVAGMRGSRLIGGMAASAYPVLTTLAVALFAGDPAPIRAGTEVALGTVAAPLAQVAGHPSTLQPQSQWYFVFGEGAGMFIGTSAALLGWLAVRDRTTRLAWAAAPFAVFVLLLSPGMLDVLDDTVGAGSILWRSAWVLPIPAAVGALLAMPAGMSDRRRRAAGAAGVVAVLAVLAVTGRPVLSAENRGLRIDGIAWDVEQGPRAAADRLVALGAPGSLAATPVPVGGALAISTVKVRPVLPRESYLSGPHVVAGFKRHERALVTRAVTSGIDGGEAARFRTALDVLGVDLACTRPELDGDLVTLALRRAGFEPVESDAQCDYWAAG